MQATKAVFSHVVEAPGIPSQLLLGCVPHGGNGRVVADVHPALGPGEALLGQHRRDLPEHLAAPQLLEDNVEVKVLGIGSRLGPWVADVS